METKYQPQTIEPRWSQHWQQLKLNEPSQQGESFCIMLPPPNVTGTLHMGHGFQQTLMDVLSRYHRMLGENTLWQAGTDAAGIATQMVVERQLSQQNKTRHDIGREPFVERVSQWAAQSSNTIRSQMQRLGTSIDWSTERYSIDPEFMNATNTAFVKLYQEGFIYRGKKLVNWDPVLNTAISDLEVENIQKSGHLWHIHYPLSNGQGQLTVATTRPETLLGDAAVAVHPEDERYAHLIGQTVELPLCNRKIPIIADDYVDPEFGTGCVKITPAHDFNDYEMGQRHQLPCLNILTKDAHINDEAPAAYRGLERFQARKAIIKDLKQLELLEKTEDYTVTLPMGDRSGTVIEPMLTDQWFVKTIDLAKPAIEAVQTGDLEFVPNNWSKTYLQWLENIQDWCISRQTWWGHRIPAWYDEDGKVYVGMDEAEVREQNQLTDEVKLTQETDILDTWFTSALWPFATLGWPENTERLNTFYPTSILVTGFDIIFFWVARMVMLGLKFTGEVPFRQVYIHGLIRDSKGHKMSKTKGNVLDPIDLIDGIDLASLIKKRTTGLMQPQMAVKIEKATTKEFPQGIEAHGTDALRFTYCALATTGRDINFDMGRIAGYRNFCNKLWNAARFVLMNCEGFNANNTQELEFSMADHWITSELQNTIKQAHEAYRTFRFDLLAQLLYDFFWNEYCDWYLELAKINSSQSTQYTLLSVLEIFLRLVHPLMPFISEDIWQRLKQPLQLEGESIMVASYPQFDKQQCHKADTQAINELKQIITAIRNIRGEMNISPATKIMVYFDQASPAKQQLIDNNPDLIKYLAKVDNINWHNAETKLPASASSILEDLSIHVPLAGIIDKDAELARIDKSLQKLNKEIEKIQLKLNNEKFTANAPTELVAKEREQLQQAQQTMAQLQEHRDRIQKL